MQTQFNIQKLSNELTNKVQHKIDTKTKPIGSLGRLEKLALKISRIQDTDAPKLSQPTMVIFAGDHGIARDGVSAYPQDVTYQMVLNFLNDGAAINVLCRQNGINLKVVDAGVNFDFPETPDLINAKIGYGTKSYLSEQAMTSEQLDLAINKGAEICYSIFSDGSNIIGFGEMGIGNTSSASLLMSKICHMPVVECIGRGTGLDDKQLKKKVDLLEESSNTHDVNEPLDILKTFGGFEIAMMCGAILKAAELKMVIMIDGFIATSALLIAQAIYPEIMDYVLFCHQSDEQGHAKMLRYLGASPILNLGLRLGEGTGCAIAYPIIKSSVNFLNEMASFESAGVSQKE